MNESDFKTLVSQITQRIANQSLDAQLETWLNHTYPADGAHVQAIRQGCEAGMAAGWLCAQSHGGIRYGRLAQASEALAGFSIDVVDMCDVAGPHHRHPLGEIDLILPVDATAMFDGHGAGWLVYSPDSAHRPTVTHGRAWVLYLLPQGQIEFTRAPTPSSSL